MILLVNGYFKGSLITIILAILFCILKIVIELYLTEVALSAKSQASLAGESCNGCYYILVLASVFLQIQKRYGI